MINQSQGAPTAPDQASAQQAWMGGADDGGVQSPEAILETLSYETSDAALFPGSLREVYFFAYDLLLDQSLVSRYIKGLRMAKIAMAPHHRLVWPYYHHPAGSALPSIERTNREGDAVWGILYDARKMDFKPLERHLKVPNRYHRHALNIFDRGGRRFSVFTYTLTLRDPVPAMPSAGYRDKLAAAAKERGLPEEWLTHLLSFEVSGQEQQFAGPAG